MPKVGGKGRSVRSFFNVHSRVDTVVRSYERELSSMLACVLPQVPAQRVGCCKLLVGVGAVVVPTQTSKTSRAFDLVFALASLRKAGRGAC